jgi:hypothetical protein
MKTFGSFATQQKIIMKSIDFTTFSTTLGRIFSKV